MKRALSSTAIAVLVLLVPGAVNASADPPNDQVTGHGATAGAFITASVAAHSGPLGEDPHGHLKFDVFAPQSGQVRCLAVAGNEAVVGIDRTDTPPGFGAFLIVRDNEETGAPDLISSAVSTEPTPARCALLLAALEPIFPVTDGDFRVRDAIPSP